MPHAAPHVRLHQRPENATNRTNLQYRLHTALRVAPADHLLCHRARRGPNASLLHAVSRRIVVCNSQVGNNGPRINLERASISWYVVYDSLIQYKSTNKLRAVRRQGVLGIFTVEHIQALLWKNKGRIIISVRRKREHDHGQKRETRERVCVMIVYVLYSGPEAGAGPSRARLGQS